jgi:hypothetical protein
LTLSFISTKSQKTDHVDNQPRGAEEKDKPHYSIVLSRYDHDSGEYKDKDATQKTKKKEIGPQNKSKRAFTFRRYVMPRSKYIATESIQSEVAIEFEPLQKLLGKLTV